MNQAKDKIAAKKQNNKELEMMMIDNRTDEIRSTWWSSNMQQNRKFMRWMQNEQIKQSIGELIKVGVLEPQEPNVAIEHIIQELIEKLFDEDAIFEESNWTDRAKAQKTLLIVRHKLHEIMNKY